MARPDIHKGLGLPCCFSEAGLFGQNMLELPIKSIRLGYKQEKGHLVLELKNPVDPLIRSAKVISAQGANGRHRMRSIGQSPVSIIGK